MLNVPSAEIESDQGDSGNHNADVKFLEFTRYNTPNHQCGESNHDAGDDVSGQDDEDRAGQSGQCVDFIVKIYLGNNYYLILEEQ